MSKEATAYIQTGLRDLGYSPGAVDGLYGPKTRAAAEGWIAASGRPASTDLPWMAEARRVLGRHEVRDNNWLRSWLKSDGRTLGDPAKLPWCGDFVETCIRLALPSESLPGALGQNPYWARNWLLLGANTKPTYGAILVFERGSGGHVGFAVGADAACYHVLGGNQSNAVTIARIERKRLLGARWPASFPARAINLPTLSAAGTISKNEA